MDIFYVLGGLALTILGVYLAFNQVKLIKAGKDDQLGFDYKLLAGGVILVMCGIALMLKYL